MYRYWVIWCYLIFMGVGFGLPPGMSQSGQLDRNSCLMLLRQYRIEELAVQAQSIRQTRLKELMVTEAEFLKTGLMPDSILIFDKANDSIIDPAIHYLYANYVARSGNHPDSSVYRLLFEAYNAARDHRDTLLVNMILPRIHHFYFRNGEEMDQFGAYLNVHERFARDSIDLFWYYYYAIGREMKLMERGEQGDDTMRMNHLIMEMERYAPSTYFKAYGLQQKAIYADVFRQQKQKALDLYQRAKALYQSIPYYYAQKGVPGMRFNEAILQYETGQFREALSYFIHHQKSERNAVYQIYGNEWIYKCYEGLKQVDSAYHYFKEMVRMKEALDQSGTALHVNKIEFDYSLDQKDEELSLALAEATSQKRRSRTFLWGIVLFAGLNILAYFVVRKWKNKTVLLEEEKSETIVRLEELKNIVTKDFILLNDRTKVYVSELMYIKSDDHYLNIFLHSGKSVFVRGSLKDMYRELPPNFKRCHRSYIVNQNYISKIESSVIILVDGSSIPISKSYRGELK